MGGECKRALFSTRAKAHTHRDVQKGGLGFTGKQGAGDRFPPPSLSTGFFQRLRWKLPHVRPCAGHRHGRAEGGAEPGGAGARPASDSAHTAHLVYKGGSPQNPQYRLPCREVRCSSGRVCHHRGSQRQTLS